MENYLKPQQRPWAKTPMEMDNAVMINASAKGKYTWRVDCIEEGTGKTDRGVTWKFTVV